MRFIVNDVAATPNSGGVFSILEDFYNDVLESDKENEWYFILSGNYFPESENVHILVRNDLKKSKFKRLFFELFKGKNFINKLEPDVFISLQNICTIGVKAHYRIVYLHQPVPFQKLKNFSFFKKKERTLFVYQKLIGSVIKLSLNIEKPNTIVQTKWMKKALVYQTKVPLNKIYIAHPRIYDRQGEENINLSNLSFKSFFYPASNFIYKNHQVILEAIKVLHNRGIFDFKVNLTVNKDQLKNDSENINFLGHISRRDVFKMYNSNVLIFPSYIESFGLPLVEAALKGTLVFSSDTEFSHELLDNYENAYFFRYDDAEALANLMEKSIKGQFILNRNRLNLNDNGEPLLTSIQKIIRVKN